MTARKLSSDWNQRLEELAIRELERTPTPHWHEMVLLWKIALPQMHPASRVRIIRTCLQLARKRRNALSAKFLKLFADHAIHELDAGDSSRAAVHDEGKMREAARYRASHPNASFAEIANAVGMPGKKTTIRSWQERRDFQAFYDDAMWLLKHDAEQEERWKPKRKKTVHRKRKC